MSSSSKSQKSSEHDDSRSLTDSNEQVYKSDDDGELNFNMNKLMFGDALNDMGEEAEEGLANVGEEVAIKNLFSDRGSDEIQSPKNSMSDHPLFQNNADEPFDINSDSSDEVEAKLSLLYKICGQKDSPDERVLCFSEVYMPDNPVRRAQMVKYNKSIMEPYQEEMNETVRARKRLLKENYKLCMKTHLQKAKFLAVNQFMEDAYFLHGYSKQGLAVSSKKHQWHPGYKKLGDSSQQLPSQVARIIPHKRQMPSNQPRTINLQPEPLFFVKEEKPSPVQQNMVKKLVLLKIPEAKLQDKFMLEACQINELMGEIKFKNDGSNYNSANDVGTTSISGLDKTQEFSALEQLKQKLKKCKRQMQVKLTQQFPVLSYTPVEKQCYSFQKQLQKYYELDQSERKKSKTLEEIFGVVSDHQIQEWTTEHKFKLLGIAQKRRKYWGEPVDCSSQQQVLKDNYECKRQEWLLHLQGLIPLKKPIFGIKIDPKFAVESKELLVVKPEPMLAIKNLKLSEPVKVPQTAQNLDPSGIIGSSYKSAQHVLVDNFDEYQILKDKEKEMYMGNSQNKIQVTAQSIMRHVRWKMGKLSDKQFYEEEYNEKVAQCQVQNLNSAINLNDLKPEGFGEILKAFEFEENLDVHFERKRIELQAEILGKKDRKERASQQNIRPSTTTAYEPIQLTKIVTDRKDSDEEMNTRRLQENRTSEHEYAHSSSESDSSDSNDENSDFQEKQKRRFQNRVLPSLGDELNHAKCIKDLSFYKLNWSGEDLMTFHRPNIDTKFEQLQDRQPTIKCVPVCEKKDEIKNKLNPHDYFKDRFKLSLNKGKYAIFEHIDQHPLFFNNFGMASRLRRYFYSDKQPSKKVFLPRHENKGSRHIGPYGELILKGQRDKLDLLGQVDLKHFKGLTVLENKMYNAPVFFHQPARTDFFCSVMKKKNGENMIAIRELDSMFTIGQIEPKLEVFNPQSRYFQNFIKSRSKAYIIRFLQENKTINFYDIVRFFPHIGEPILKKGLKEIEVEIDRNGICQFNESFDEEKFKDRMTPEMICQYESARFGQYRLETLGVTEILSADKISYSTNKFIQEETDLTLKRIAKLIESEVLSTPWNLSSNYIKIKQEGSMMMLKGQGDPSFGYGGYSFLKMPLKISQDSLQGARQNRMNLNPAIQNPKAVTGTDADLRKLQKEVIFQKLKEMGVDEEELLKRTRWQMVGLLRHYASNQQENRQYARGVRYTSKKQLEMYSQQAKENFLLQMQNLSDYNPSYVHDESEDDPDFEYEQDEIEELSKIGQKKKKWDREKGCNATDFRQEIQESIQDDNRKLVVEMKEDIDIKRIEDIKDYLKLLLVITPLNDLKASNPSGINIGGVTANQEYAEALNGSGQRDLERQLLEKLKNREKTKKCEILCKKIRSLTNTDLNQTADGKIKYQRIIFCADEKAIKKFRRCKNKNSQKIPRNKKPRNQNRAFTRPSLLTEDRLGSESQRSGSHDSSAAIRSGTGRKTDSMYSQSLNSGNFNGQPQTGQITITSASLQKHGNKSRRKDHRKSTGPVINMKVSDSYADYGRSKNEIQLQHNSEFSFKHPQFQQDRSRTSRNNQEQSGEFVVSLSLPSHGNSRRRNAKRRRNQDPEDDEDMGQDEGEDYEMASDEDFSEDFHPELSSRNRSRRQNRHYFAEPTRISQRANQAKLQKKKSVSSQSRFKSLGFSKEDFDYQVQPGMNNKSQRKRQQACDQALNQIFQEILEEMWNYDKHGIFHNQVTKQDAPTYKDIIKNPIALKDMKNKSKRNEYKHRNQFIQDATIMYQNASLFNGRDHNIAQLGLQLEQLCIRRTRDRSGEIINLETLVEENITHSNLL